jgi:hypothetical protein
MSEQFKKGQLVAVRSSSPEYRRIRIFVGMGKKEPDGTVAYLCREAGERDTDALTWPHCVPLEKVDPGAFIARESNATEAAIHAVEMESELVQRLRRQIEWLCEELADDDSLCVDPSAIDLCDHECARCWEQASLKASLNAVAKEEANG